MEQCDMCRAMNVRKVAKGGLSCATIEETRFVIKILVPRSDITRSALLSFSGIER